MTSATPLFGLTGWKNSGKTTLATRLIAELVDRGYRVSSIKHAHHAFDIDVPGTDSFRHRAAGAREVAIVSDTRWALMHELRDDDEPAIAEIVARLSPADVIIVEGYKRENHPKIECRRKDTHGGEPLSAADPMIVAVAADYAAETDGLPLFALDDVPRIADFVVGLLNLPEPAGPRADADRETA